MADNYTPAPAPSKAEFNALSQQVDTLNDKMTAKTSPVSGTTNEYGELITNISANDIHAIRTIRIEYSGNLAHAFTAVTATGYLIIVVLNRNNQMLANTAVTGTVYYI